MSSDVIPMDAPLKDMDEWDDFLTGRYKEGKSESEFRQYDETATPGVAEFYRLNHQYQTFDYVMAKEKEYFGLDKGMKSIWEAAEFLNTLVDDSDPDTDLTQIEHLLQTSEAIRKDGHPRWFVLTGFIHDLGKVLCLWGEPQWGSLGIRFRSAVPIRRILFSRSISRPILTSRIRCIRRNMAFTSQIAVSTRCTCRLGTTDTSAR